jgi:Male sterility protein
LRNPDFENKGPVAEDVLPNPVVSVGHGYAESKWIAERILDAAADRTPLRPVVVRLGQVCGEGNGTWNEKEWFPSLVKSALRLDCLPSLDGVSEVLIAVTALSLIGRLDCFLDHSARCRRSDTRDVAHLPHTRRTHLPRCAPTWCDLQHARWFDRIVARRSTCTLPRMAFETV